MFEFFFDYQTSLADNYEILYTKKVDKVAGAAGMQTEIPKEFDLIAMLDSLSKGDITKHKEIGKLNYLHCMNMLAFWAYRDREYESQRLAQQNKR